MTDETTTETTEEAATETTEPESSDDDNDLIESIVEVAKAPFEWLLGRGIGTDED